MDSSTKIFQRILYAEALTTPNWKRYFSTLTDAGVTSMEEFLSIEDKDWDVFEIPILLKTRLQQFKTRFTNMQLSRNNSFSQPFQHNEIFNNFEFVPQLMCEQYFIDVPMNDIAIQLPKAIYTVEKSGHGGITEHQAIMIALYCQEGTGQTNSFYYLLNKCLREREQNLIGLRPAIYLLDSALRTLPKFNGITWRGINVAPDLRKFIVGQEVCFAGICSTSTDKNKALYFMDISPPSRTHKHTLFKMHVNAGVFIQQWSCIKDESEVVTPFCSRWKVLSIKTDQNESFDDIDDYHCDYIIELEQIEGELLFPNHESPIGLHLLSKINFQDNPEILKTDFKAKFISFFGQLTDTTAKSILETFLGEDWDKKTCIFQASCGNDKIIFDHFTQFLGGIHNLLHEFQSLNVHIKNSFRISERHNIYSERQLLWCTDGSERTVKQLCDMGFSRECAKKIYEQDALKQELEVKYKSSKLDLRGTAEDPKNVGRWLSDLRFKHCAWHDGCLIGYYDLGKAMVKSVKDITPKMNKLLSKTVFRSDIVRFSDTATLSFNLQCSDLIIGTAIFAVELGSLCIQLYCGDITFKQFLKSLTTSAVAIAAGAIGASIGSCFGVTLMMYLGFLGWPVTAGALIGTLAGGLVTGVGFEMFYQKFLKHLAPDGEKEDMNALRKLYLAALTTLNCTPDSTMTTIKRAYYELALRTHPDKFENKQSAKEEFQKVVAAYEIAKNYHEVLENAFQALNVPNNISITELEEWAKRNRCDGEKEKAYKIIYRHLTCSRDKMKWLRDQADSDRQLKLNDSKSLSVVKK
ncbi:unnamed protein product [Rotaria socialis]|uniref:NAD(P)(+)--arginine ADP-ribosyltransferase n=2 Tax=Rotaria socialis TaxID=392032 RepID=A0A820THH4_9BILA|nr:unnamed protein product [Rotaria socialis]CAF3492072.1 unnamed protein product [Rotaria socialis]CAF4466675.1 unnamed protein product [Rotaria socialis]CAF4559087.1 unnamed protein product [Rotaria socialis]